ncbi:hypothetical protein [Janibacter melonis]|uniref:hypothetical protein n=1 Tax=Janibacter melonis TaxID=262209 RepID=UPI0020944799|nr:hypothetical protein [Janibacter melonis]
MRGAASGGNGQDDLAAQRVLGQQVEEGLEQTAVGRLVDRVLTTTASALAIVATAAATSGCGVGSQERLGGQVAQDDGQGEMPGALDPARGG